MQRLDQFFALADELFSGKHPDFQAIDVPFHDYEHTMEVLVCMVCMLEARLKARVEPRLNARQTELAVVAALFHDSGYLRSRSDTTGTGAKFTFMHVLRSCSNVATYLPALNVSISEVHAVNEAIQCTGPTSKISQRHFANDSDAIIGCALATADYLGQMAAPDYPDELDALFGEFKESYDYYHVAHSARLFSSAEELKGNTAFFWVNIVKPKLDNDFQAVYRFLNSPYPSGINRYITGIEANLAKIDQGLARHSDKIA
ncbi:MAG: hypothetical protein K9M98_06955 [Cephaloticoccus sp.]|nr:hypothetical protein [Cephaloticoccus sp.]MCF7760227.1 hypothetical protein [Cephaloticoccus sp.]